MYVCNTDLRSIKIYWKFMKDWRSNRWIVLKFGQHVYNILIFTFTGTIVNTIFQSPEIMVGQKQHEMRFFNVQEENA